MALLLYECERAKKALSGDNCLVYQSELQDLPGLGSTSFKTNITRTNLEELCNDYFKQCMQGVDVSLAGPSATVSPAHVSGTCLRIPLPSAASRYFGSFLCPFQYPEHCNMQLHGMRVLSTGW